MKIEMIEKANYYYMAGKIILDFESDRCIWFKVGEDYEHLVRFEYRGDGSPLKVTCTCEYISNKECYFPICPHKITGLLYLASRYALERRKKNQKKEEK